MTSTYQRILHRIHGRSIWWFVAASVALAFMPLSTPVLIVLYVVLAVFFWIPLAAATASRSDCPLRQAEIGCTSSSWPSGVR